MKKINETMNHMTVTAYVKGNQMKNKVADILRRKEGEGFVDTALKILISVVVGALLLAGLYTENHEPVQLPWIVRTKIHSLPDCICIRQYSCKRREITI